MRLVNQWFAFCLILAPMLVACSTSYVSHTSISGEVAAVKNWQIVWVDSLAWAVPPVLPKGVDQDKVRGLSRFCGEFVSEVRTEVVRQGKVSAYSNMPVDGTIKLILVPRGARPLSFDYYGQNRARDVANYMQTRSASERAPEVVAELAGGVLTALLEGGHHMDGVRVGIADSSGKSLGEVYLAGKGRHDVDPKKVCETIGNLIRTGKN